MNRRDVFFAVGMVLIGVLLVASLLRPSSPAAFELPATGIPASISAAGDSAWVLMGNKVYYLTLRPRGEVSNRIISQIDVQELR